MRPWMEPYTTRPIRRHPTRRQPTIRFPSGLTTNRHIRTPTDRYVLPEVLHLATVPAYSLIAHVERDHQPAATRLDPHAGPQWSRSWSRTGSTKFALVASSLRPVLHETNAHRPTNGRPDPSSGHQSLTAAEVDRRGFRQRAERRGEQ